MSVVDSTILKELIPIHIQQRDGEVVQTVEARDLHSFLEVKSEFRNWIKNRIADYGFVQDVDFIAGNFLPGSDRVDYHISLDMAKELAMVERNEKGRQARKYFLECERKLKQEQPASAKQLTQAQIILLQAQQLVELEARQAEQDERIKRVEVKQQAIEEGFKYFTILAFSALNNIPVDLSMAKKLGKKAAALSREKGLSIDRVRDPRFGVIGSYHESILQTVFAEEIG